MWPFKKKHKVQKHDLRDVTGIPQYHQFYRAVRCIHCDKQYVMDVFGGWSVEWNFKIGTWRIDEDDFDAAVKHMHSKPSSEWNRVEYAECEIVNAPTV